MVAPVRIFLGFAAEELARILDRSEILENHQNYREKAKFKFERIWSFLFSGGPEKFILQCFIS